MVSTLAVHLATHASEGGSPVAVGAGTLIYRFSYVFARSTAYADSSLWRSRRYQAVLHGEDGGFELGVNPQLDEDALHMRPYGVHRQQACLGDPPIAVASTHQLEHVPLARAQRPHQQLDLRLALVCRRRLRRGTGERQVATLGEPAEHLGELLLGAAAEHGDVVVDRAEVEDEDVWLVVTHDAQAHIAVVAHPDDGDVPLALEQEPQPLDEHVLAVDHDRCDSLGSLPDRRRSTQQHGSGPPPRSAATPTHCAIGTRLGHWLGRPAHRHFRKAPPLRQQMDIGAGRVPLSRVIPAHGTCGRAAPCACCLPRRGPRPRDLHLDGGCARRRVRGRRVRGRGGLRPHHPREGDGSSNRISTSTASAPSSPTTARPASSKLVSAWTSSTCSPITSRAAPAGSRQRRTRNSSGTNRNMVARMNPGTPILMVCSLTSRTCRTVKPACRSARCWMLTMLSKNGLRYMKKKALRDPASATDPIAGRSRARPARRPSAGSAHCDRSGAVMIKKTPVNNPRWVGLSSAAMFRSIPNARCQAISPSPDSPKIA